MGLIKGNGVVKQNRNGAYFVYSRTNIAEVTKQTSNHRNQPAQKVIFLMGPTPRFFGKAELTNLIPERELTMVRSRPQLHGGEHL